MQLDIGNMETQRRKTLKKGLKGRGNELKISFIRGVEQDRRDSDQCACYVSTSTE